jgi:hypothetical protein
MKRIYDDILLSTDSSNKKTGVRALADYGKKAIPYIQQLRNIETDEDEKTICLTLTQIEKARP